MNNSYIYIYHVNVTQTVPDISPLMPMHQDPLLVWYIWSYFLNFPGFKIAMNMIETGSIKTSVAEVSNDSRMLMQKRWCRSPHTYIIVICRAKTCLMEVSGSSVTKMLAMWQHYHLNLYVGQLFPHTINIPKFAGVVRFYMMKILVARQ